MNIQTALDNYKSLGEYLSPDYGQDNEVLSNFKRSNPTLSKDQSTWLIEILRDSKDVIEKYFVADLLYLYDSFDIDLLEPMLRTAIDFKDPSFNRIFLRPCINVFGAKKISEILLNYFNKGDMVDRIGISTLIYWLRPQENGEADDLHKAIMAHANSTDNIVELYYYRLRYQNKIKNADKIPDNPNELINMIRGNADFENLLFNILNWTKSSH